MSDTINLTGKCLCGAVRLTANTVDTKATACHCGMCRKWGGGPFMATDCGTDLLFEGEENIAVFNSSKWADRGFCKQCGSHLFYRLKGNNQYFIPVGLLDDEEKFVFNSQVFIDKKPSYYSFANKTNDMTEAEIFEMFGAP